MRKLIDLDDFSPFVEKYDLQSIVIDKDEVVQIVKRMFNILYSAPLEDFPWKFMNWEEMAVDGMRHFPQEVIEGVNCWVVEPDKIDLLLAIPK